jgi:hypothetical protein
MVAMLQQDQDKENELSDGMTNVGSQSLAIGLGLGGWAAIMTIAVVLLGVFVYRRVRKTKIAEAQWSSAASQFSDAETGSMRSGMSAASSVVDLSSDQGHSNAAYDNATCDNTRSLPDLNQDEIDFAHVHGVFEEDSEQAGEDSFDPSFSNAKAAFGTVVPKGSISKGMGGLFRTDKGNSFM